MKISVIQAGCQTSLQDAGRQFSQQDALASAGVMDDYAFRWANALLGNPLNAPVIEITQGGEHWQIEQDGVLALCGADLDSHLNQIPIKPWQSFRVKTGDQLIFRGPKHGLRAYVATTGGWQAERYYNSASCALREHANGGWGYWIKSGDLLESTQPSFNPQGAFNQQLRQVSSPYQPHYHNPTIPLILDAQASGFRPDDNQAWLQTPAKVQAASNRMGIRLTCPYKLEWQTRAPLSEPTAMGAVQITPSGDAIVLMADRQTIGGYPKIGHVSWWGRTLLAQAQPNNLIHWQPIERPQAKQQQTSWYQFWQHCISN
ncbi:5-oxoprolinase subunit C family protein [Thiomicrospira microaerophila]|uniref:5-oxoprolinase subunit C family protein n=1 Tax=Thiomicrospira microaerophila TaxID=406020 RepID=UPI0006974583|nr:biotin-dependent carboxyltransferase family protein [Thiomicrospira microaerophila]